MNAPELQVQFDPSSARFGASRSQKRLEDDRLLAGRGLYSDDRQLDAQAWLVLVRSPHAHARIASIELSAAKAAPGVLAAWTMADLRGDVVAHIPFPPLLKRADGSPMAAPLRTPLAEGTVHYVGQPVVAIVAETRSQAQDAAELVALEYQDLAAVVDAKSAVAPGAPLVWEGAPGNVAAEAEYGDRAAVQAAFARPDRVVEIELHNQRVSAMALAPRASLALYESGRT
jgi:carbon-monoxide dehydrogenase large subunit